VTCRDRLDRQARVCLPYSSPDDFRKLPREMRAVAGQPFVWDHRPAKCATMTVRSSNKGLIYSLWRRPPREAPLLGDTFDANYKKLEWTRGDGRYRPNAKTDTGNFITVSSAR